MTDNIEELSAEFRQHLPDVSLQPFAKRTEDPYMYAERMKTRPSPPEVRGIMEMFEKQYREPYKGLTADGNIIPNLYQEQDEGVDIDQIVDAANSVISQASETQREKLFFDIDAREWRAWSNPEILLRPLGLRLEEIDELLAQSILGVLAATFSTEGYAKALAAMRINHFLGELVELPRIMNKYSYNFLIFGKPSTRDAWGWSLYGHHLCINVFLQRAQMVVSPVFVGAEPNLIDEGEFKGTAILHRQAELGLALMQSLPPTVQKEVQIYEQMHDPKMPEWRWNFADQRHLCGAYQDNRVVPYEGVTVSSMSERQQQLVLDIVEEFVIFLPDQARRMKLEHVRRHFAETFFSWIGPYEDRSAFYYRIQSPVIVVEFDHHSAIYLANKEPMRFHTHTIIRSPNRGDYGYALRDLSSSNTTYSVENNAVT